MSKILINITLVYLVLTTCPLLSHAGIYSCYSGKIPGCNCTTEWNISQFTYKVVLSCTGAVGTATEFGDNLHTLTKGYQFDDFIISSYPNTRLPNAPFDASTSIKRIIIKDSPKLEGFGPKGKPDTGLFKNLGPSLETLVLSNNPAIRMDEWENIAKQLNSDTPGDLALKTLVIKNSPEFDDIDLIQNLAPTLQTLVLRANGLSNFDYDLAAYAVLNVLDLSENQALKKFVLKKKPPKLTSLFINGAGLTNFTIATLEQMMKADFVNLANNKLHCDCYNRPPSFNNEDNEKRFMGSRCATPAAVNGVPYTSMCLPHNF